MTNKVLITVHQFLRVVYHLAMHPLLLGQHLICVAGIMLSYPKNISAVKKCEAKKVQVTEQLKGVKSL